MHDSPMAGQLTEGDLWESKGSVFLARQQNIIGSWLDSTPAATANSADQDDENDFKGTREAAGVGAINQDEDSELDGILKRKRTDNDKLLENLLGKKAAEAHKKSRKADAGKSMSLSKHAAPKPITSASNKSKSFSRPQESDDEEEVGRAAAFTSKKTRDTKVPAYATAGGSADVQVDPDAEPPDPREEVAILKELAKQDEPEETRPKKRKVGSYLDEVLGQRGKKSKKKKKGKGGGGEGD